MSKITYLQCPTGISGDMFLGALVSLGVPLDYLSNKLDALGIASEYKLRAQPVHRRSQVATQVFVDLAHHHHHHHHHHDHHHGRHLPEIEAMIIKANLPARVEAWSLAVFRQLAAAEGAVHGISPQKVHFHEVGAVDAIVDMVGVCLGLDWLGVDSDAQGWPLLYCSALPTGGGTVSAAHGVMAVPVPAVLKLWEMRGCPVYSNGIDKELVTPTGAAIATTLVRSFGDPPPMTIKKVGLGAGSLDLSIPNILRLWYGESSSIDANNSDNSHLQNTEDIQDVTVLQTQIDDLNPQVIGYLFDALFAAGAVDVFTQSIGMKKSRPGILLTVICHHDKVEICENILFRETTTLGIRRHREKRRILQRKFEEVVTNYGTVRVKVARYANSENVINVHPEYEDCAILAREHNLPLREVQKMVLEVWYSNYQPSVVSSQQ